MGGVRLQTSFKFKIILSLFLSLSSVSPQVSLLQKSSSSSVTCHATGFYPSGVTISWMKNGQDHDEDVDLGELLPNEDGTFQKTSTLKVTPEEWKNNEYSCVVEHQGETFRKILTDGKILINYSKSDYIICRQTLSLIVIFAVQWNVLSAY